MTDNISRASDSCVPRRVFVNENPAIVAGFREG